jgi:hypothetical protein
MFENVAKFQHLRLIVRCQIFQEEVKSGLSAERFCPLVSSEGPLCALNSDSSYTEKEIFAKFNCKT